MEIIPTILETTEEGFILQFIRLVPYFRTFQIDVADSEFAGHDTLDLPAVTQAVSQIPPELLTDVVFDFHLMTKKYADKIDYCRALNKDITVRNILVHQSLSPDYARLTSSYPQYTFGAVLNSEDPVPAEKEAAPLFSLPIIQLMTVHIGAQGNPFITDVLIKIEQLKNRGYTGKIFIDGGVNATSLSLILSKEKRPDVLCVGSYLTRSQNLPKDAEYLFDVLRNKESK